MLRDIIVMLNATVILLDMHTYLYSSAKVKHIGMLCGTLNFEIGTFL